MIAIKDGTFTENKPTLSTILHHAFGHVKAEIIPTKIPTDMKMNVLDNIATIYFIKSTRLFSYPFYQGYSLFSIIVNRWLSQVFSRVPVITMLTNISGLKKAQEEQKAL